MSGEILLGIGALVLPVLTYFAGVKRTESQYKDTDKKAKIYTVLNEYLKLSRNHITRGLVGLQKAGAATLKNNSEIRELIDFINSHGEEHPLRCAGIDLFDNKDLKVFFDYAKTNNIKFPVKDWKELIKESGA